MQKSLRAFFTPFGLYYFKNKNLNTPTGQADPINNIYTREMIGKMTADEYLEHEPMIMEQLKTALKYFINIFFIMSSGRGYFLWKK